MPPRERSKAYIFFVDDNLVGSLSHAKELLTMLSQYRLRWVSQGPIHIAEDDALVKLMARAGCHGLFIGFDSLREENLNLMGKRINLVQAYEKGIQKLHEAGIGVYASFVLNGYDYDDASVFDEFIAFAEKNRVDGAFLPILTPFPGTRVYQRLKEEERLLDGGLVEVRYGHGRLSTETNDRGRTSRRVLEGESFFLFHPLHAQKTYSVLFNSEDV